MTKSEREAAKNSLGRCEACGKDNTFTSRKAAVKFGRKIHARHGHLNGYECPHRPGFYHYGRLPGMVKQGKAPRSALRPRHAAAA